MSCFFESDLSYCEGKMFTSKLGLIKDGVIVMNKAKQESIKEKTASKLNLFRMNFRNTSHKSHSCEAIEDPW